MCSTKCIAILTTFTPTIKQITKKKKKTKEKKKRKKTKPKQKKPFITTIRWVRNNRPKCGSERHFASERVPTDSNSLNELQGHDSVAFTLVSSEISDAMISLIWPSPTSAVDLFMCCIYHWRQMSYTLSGVYITVFTQHNQSPNIQLESNSDPRQKVHTAECELQLCRNLCIQNLMRDSVSLEGQTNSLK